MYVFLTVYCMYILSCVRGCTDCYEVKYIITVYLKSKYLVIVWRAHSFQKSYLNTRAECSVSSRSLTFCIFVCQYLYIHFVN